VKNFPRSSQRNSTIRRSGAAGVCLSNTCVCRRCDTSGSLFHIRTHDLWRGSSRLDAIPHTRIRGCWLGNYQAARGGSRVAPTKTPDLCKCTDGCELCSCRHLGTHTGVPPPGTPLGTSGMSSSIGAYRTNIPGAYNHRSSPAFSVLNVRPGLGRPAQRGPCATRVGSLRVWSFLPKRYVQLIGKEYQLARAYMPFSAAPIAWVSVGIVVEVVLLAGAPEARALVTYRLAGGR